MRLSRREKQALLVAGVIACLLGALAGYSALCRELEMQFHGGVLDEDRARVMWQNARVTALAFGGVAAGAWLVMALAVIGVFRLLAWARR